MYKYLKRFVLACRLRLLDEWERRYSAWRRRWFVVSFQWNKMYPADRRQIRAILFLLTVVVGLLVVVPERHQSIYSDKETDMAILAWEKQQRQDSIEYSNRLKARFLAVRNQFRKQDSLRRSKWKRTNKRIVQRPLRLVPFDPNTVDSASLVHMGIAEWMASNLIKYREAGKVFVKSKEMRSLYGMTPALYDSLLKYVVIDSSYVQQKLKRRKDSCRLFIARAQGVHSEDTRLTKLHLGEHIELNHADTMQLKRIPGVGSKIAQMLVRYRDQLGGFVSVHQVRDIYLNDSILDKWLVVDQSCVHKLKINHASLMELKRHPYCSYIQAKAIVNYRKHFGVIHNVEELGCVEEMSSHGIEQWTPYLDFSP